MRGYERQEREPAADVDHLSRFEAEMERLKTEREKAVQHAEDRGYQVEVLRAKLHEARRSLATRPAYDGADIGYQAEQMLRNAQMQARYDRGSRRQPRGDIRIVDELEELCVWCQIWAKPLLMIRE